MKLNEFITKMNDEIAHYKTSVRKERAAQLVWFLMNFYRLDEDMAIDLVCDSDNDKGIDGIFVDDQTEEVYIFQSKYSPHPASSQGDNDLRNFKGARAWFDSPANVQLLDNSNASQELKSLVTKLEVFDKLGRGFKLFMVFLTNKRFDPHAVDYLGVLRDEIEAWDIDRLYAEYTYAGKDKPVDDKFVFSVDPANAISYKSSANVKAIIFPAKATEIVKLSGIQDRTLFARNVRYGIGKTRVNKDIARTLSDNSEHENFFLYHNGITLVCSSYDLNGDRLEVTSYSIVNGCQSTLSFYENQKHLTDTIRILLRVIQTGDRDRLSQDITYYTNNQNAISPKDLRSNDKVQQDLQEEFNNLFHHEILYKIKAGEDESSYKRTIENDFVAQLITSFYLIEPYIAHQKTQIFSDNYTKIFNRYINASYIFLMAEMYRAIDEHCDRIEDEGMRTYKSTRFFFIYVFRRIFDSDPIGKRLLDDPAEFFKNYKDKFYAAFETLFKLLALDFNYYVNGEKQKGYFDYKNTLRNAAKVTALADELIHSYNRQLVRHPEDAFSQLMG